MHFSQQGDCLIKESTIPSDAKPTGSGVLVESAVTNHTHRVNGNAEVLKSGTTLYIRSETPFHVVHEEHKTLTIPKGEYRVDAVIEYDHLLEESRAVAD